MSKSNVSFISVDAQYIVSKKFIEENKEKEKEDIYILHYNFIRQYERLRSDFPELFED
jgi:hypothetical protein